MRTILTLLFIILFTPSFLKAQTFDSFLEYCLQIDKLNVEKQNTVHAVVDSILTMQSWTRVPNKEIDCFAISKQLTRTNTLTLRNNELTFFPRVAIADDLEVLSVLKNIEHLSIHGNSNKNLDMKPLTKLKLKTLEIKSDILNANELENIVSLEKLIIKDKDLPNIKNMPNLINLHVKINNQKTNLSKLIDATQIKTLELSVNEFQLFSSIQSSITKTTFSSQHDIKSTEAFRVNALPHSVTHPQQKRPDHIGPDLSLSEINFMNNLKTLIISGVNLKDGAELEKLNELESLVLRNTKIHQPLIMSQNSILENIEFQNVRNFETIGFSNTQNIKKFVTVFTQIDSLNDLINNTNLIELTIPGAGLRSISGLKNFQKLETLNLSGNRSYLGELLDLTHLKNLNINDTGLSNDYVLTSSKSLEVLLADSNKLTTINGLTNMTNLKEVSLKNNQIKSIDPLFYKNKIHSISLSNNRINNLMPLSTMSALLKVKDLKLDLSSNKITSTQGISSMRNISNLNLSDNSISNIGDIASLHKLKELNLDNNFIQDISNLKWATNINQLSLKENSIEDVQPLSELFKLTGRLDISSNRITDISVLSKLSNKLRIIVKDNYILDKTCPIAKGRCEF